MGLQRRGQVSHLIAGVDVLLWMEQMAYIHSSTSSCPQPWAASKAQHQGPAVDPHSVVSPELF